jgi:hypothetical protein
MEQKQSEGVKKYLKKIVQLVNKLSSRCFPYQSIENQRFPTYMKINLKHQKRGVLIALESNTMVKFSKQAHDIEQMTNIWH